MKKSIAKILNENKDLLSFIAKEEKYNGNPLSEKEIQKQMKAFITSSSKEEVLRHYKNNRYQDLLEILGYLDVCDNETSDVGMGYGLI